MSADDLIGLLFQWLGHYLPMLPPVWQDRIRIACEVIALASLAVAGLKKALGEPNPAKDPKWKQRLFYALHILDVAAANTTPIRAKDKHRNELEQTRAASMPPGPRPSIPPGVGMTLLIVLPLLALSCAATPLERHATIAASSADVIGEAGRLLQARLEAVERDAVATSATQEEARERIDRLRAMYAPLEAAYEAVRLAHAAYLEAILRAHVAGRERPEPDVMATLSAAWFELVKRAEMLGLLLPQPPPALRGLLPGDGS